MAKFRKVNLPAIQYRVAEGRLFLHMKSCFELLNLEAAVMSSKKGYGAINTSTSGLEVSLCYLATLRTTASRAWHCSGCWRARTPLSSASTERTSSAREGGRDWEEPDQVLEDRGLGR